MPQARAATIGALPSARVLLVVLLSTFAVTTHTVQATTGAQTPGPARAPSGAAEAGLSPGAAPLEGLVSIKSLPYLGQKPAASIALPDQDSSPAMPTQAPATAGTVQSTTGLAGDAGVSSGADAAGGGQGSSGSTTAGDGAVFSGGASAAEGSAAAGPAGSPVGAVSGSSLGGGGLVFDGNGNVVSGGSGFGDVPASYTGKQQWPELVGTNALAAKAKLLADTALHVLLVPQGSAVTDDYRTDRIRIFYDPLSFLVTSPMPQVG